MTVGFVGKIRGQAGGRLEEGSFRPGSLERRVDESGRSALASLPSLGEQLVREVSLATALPEPGGVLFVPFPVSVRKARQSKGFPFRISLGGAASRPSTARSSPSPLPSLDVLQRARGESIAQASRDSGSSEIPSRCEGMGDSSQGADDSILQTLFTQGGSQRFLDDLFRVNERSDCLNAVIEDARSLLE